MQRRRRRSSLTIVTLATLILAPVSVGAVDLYSFFDKSCRRRTGILVHVDQARVVLVGIDGKAVKMARDTMHSLALHQVLENPLREIVSNAALRGHLRQIWTERTAQPSFSGWLSGFHDELLIFFDTQGKTHVLEHNEIVRVRPVSSGADTTWSPPGPEPRVSAGDGALQLRSELRSRWPAKSRSQTASR